MAQQWRNTVCALLIGALREKQKRKGARFGFSLKAHQWRKGAAVTQIRRVLVLALWLCPPRATIADLGGINPARRAEGLNGQGFQC